MVRYNADGTLDPTFGNAGIRLTNVGDYRDTAESIVLQADSKIVVAGERGIFRPPGEERNSDIALVRYNSDGSLDSSFGNGGIVISDFGPGGTGNFADHASVVLLQPDGKIVIAGDSDGGGYYDFLVARYNANGSLDATFGNNGFTKTDLGNGDADGARILDNVRMDTVPALVPFCVSRKMHGAGVTFDVNLPLTGPAGIECRTGGANGNHQVVVNFPSPVTLASASVTGGTGSVNALGASGSQVTVDLTGVANAQTIVITLFWRERWH